MTKAFSINIATPEKLIYSGEAVSVIVPAESGYLGILADHAPLVANIASGELRVKTKEGKLHNIDIKNKGFLEVLHNQVTILLNSDLT